MLYIGVFLIGVFVGFLGGMFGKGGSAIATPMLHGVGISSFSAVASPLPATIPGTLIASYAYWRAHAVDWRLVWWSIAFGIPATIGGAIATEWISGTFLVHVTDAILVLLGIRFFFWPQNQEDSRKTSSNPHSSISPPFASPSASSLASSPTVAASSSHPSTWWSCGSPFGPPSRPPSPSPLPSPSPVQSSMPPSATSNGPSCWSSAAALSPFHSSVPR